MPTHIKRVMLKLSGEMLGGTKDGGIDEDAILGIAGEIAGISKKGYEVSVVIGGGNFFRGTLAEKFGMERSSADCMGMLGTCINGLALQAVLENQYSVDTRVMTAIKMTELAEAYIRRKALKHLSKGRVVILAGGTGNPLFTTDTAASLRALELNSEIILKGTKVDGIYDSDPEKNPDAVKLDKLTYLDVISKNLKVMDATAITMCMEAKMPIKVFRLTGENSVLHALENSDVGTTVT